MIQTFWQKNWAWNEESGRSRSNETFPIVILFKLMRSFLANIVFFSKWCTHTTCWHMMILKMHDGTPRSNMWICATGGRRSAKEPNIDVFSFLRVRGPRSHNSPCWTRSSLPPRMQPAPLAQALRDWALKTKSSRSKTEEKCTRNVFLSKWRLSCYWTYIV